MSLLETRPITTRVITATLISGLGDAICQHLVPAPGGFDIARTVRFASWAVLITPLQHLWFTALQRRFPSALTRVAFDQLVFAPPATAAFLMYMGGGGAREGTSMGDAARELARVASSPGYQLRLHPAEVYCPRLQRRRPFLVHRALAPRVAVSRAAHLAAAVICPRQATL